MYNRIAGEQKLIDRINKDIQASAVRKEIIDHPYNHFVQAMASEQDLQNKFADFYFGPDSGFSVEYNLQDPQHEICNIFKRSFGYFKAAFAFNMPIEALNFDALGEDPRKPEDIPKIASYDELEADWQRILKVKDRLDKGIEPVDTDQEDEAKHGPKHVVKYGEEIEDVHKSFKEALAKYGVDGIR